MTVEATIERVRNFYEDEARSPHIVTSLSEIPFSFDMIGPEWMTAIMCAGVPGARVTKVTLDEADDGTSNRRRIFLEYNDQGKAAGLPNSVFSKGSIGLLNRINLGLSGGAEAEVEFYDKIRPLVKARRVNSPGSARRRPSADSASSTPATTAGPPWRWNSAQSSPV